MNNSGEKFPEERDGNEMSSHTKNEYLYPTPGRALRKLLDSYAKSETPWDEYLCVQDIMLCLDREEKLKPLRYYAARWSRDKNWVHRRLKDFCMEAQRQRGFHKHHDVQNNGRKLGQKVGQSGTKVGQTGTQNGQSKQKTTHVGQEWDKMGQEWDSIVQTQITDTYNNNNRNVHLRDLSDVNFDESKLDVPPPKIDWKKRYQIVQDSWNAFAEKNNLRQIRTVSENRRKWIRARYEKIMPHIKTIYANLEASDWHMGRTHKYSGITFETLWRNKEHWIKYREMEPRQQTTRDESRLMFLGERYSGTSSEIKIGRTNEKQATRR